MKRVICISRARGALGEQVGEEVARRLGLRVVDEEIVAGAAAKENVDPDLVADAEERKSLVHRLLMGLAASGAEVARGGSACVSGCERFVPACVSGCECFVPACVSGCECFVPACVSGCEECFVVPCASGCGGVAAAASSSAASGSGSSGRLVLAV